MKTITAPAIIAKTEEKLSRLRASYACHDVLSAIAQLLREEIAYEGVSVIIPRRECIQTAARHARERKVKN